MQLKHKTRTNKTEGTSINREQPVQPDPNTNTRPNPGYLEIKQLFGKGSIAAKERSWWIL